MLTWTGPGGSWESPCAALLAAWQFDGASGGFPAAQAAISNTDVAQWGTDWASRRCSVLLLFLSSYFSLRAATANSLSPLIQSGQHTKTSRHSAFAYVYYTCSHNHTAYALLKTFRYTKIATILKRESDSLLFHFLQYYDEHYRCCWLSSGRRTGRRRSRGRFDGARGRRSRVRGLAGHSHNEKNLAAAHCVLVMRNMCCRGALLLISGGSQAFHARLVIGPEGACIRGDSNCKRVGREFEEGEQRERVKAYAPVPLPCSSCSFSAMIKHYCRQGPELQMSVLG